MNANRSTVAARSLNKPRCPMLCRVRIASAAPRPIGVRCAIAGGEESAGDAYEDAHGVSEGDLDDVRAERHREGGCAGDELVERLEGGDGAQGGDEQACDAAPGC